jgi:tetratricopeptide (TPR) repeat protein
MNMPEPANQSSPQDNAIGDQNVERLLTSAYQPEALDPAFVERVHARACTAARVDRDVAPASAANSSDARRRTSLWLAAGCTALALVLVASYVISVKVPKTTDYYPDGELIWIDGQPYLPAESEASDERDSAVLTPVRVAERPDRQDENPPLLIGEHGLTPRKRLETARPPTVSVGDSLTTKSGERRRVELPDESVLYLNENASVQINADRRITLEKGEAFVEVSPAEANGGNRFVVATPERDVTAFGTKFAINVNAKGTDVAVTHGKVKIAGVEPMLLAGQQIRDNDISPLPRASYALNWTRELMVAAESPLVPASDYGGGALIAIDPRGQEAKLSLRKYNIDVHIEDGFARTTIDQTYFNHETSRLEGTFYFPLPPDASISRLAMYVNGRLMEGGMAEREHARNVFETIKYRSLDPALLEWVDGSTFKMRVFPLEGRQEKRIVLSYTQRLDNHYARTEYRFPAGHSMDVVRDWSVKLHVDHGEALKWKCTSHDLKADSSDGDLTLTASAEKVKPNRDVVVVFEEEEHGDQATEQARFSTVEHDGSRYLMLRFRPELEVAEKRQRRDWVFLLDADGSRNPLLARVQVDIVKTLLENAAHDDTFSIVTAGTRIHAFAAEQQRVTPDNVAAAVEFLDKMHLVGALDLEKAIAASSKFAQAADRPVLVHVGAGIPILGERQTSKLLETLPKNVSYVGVGVGKRWNRQFMKLAASRTGGYFTQINPDEAVNWRAFELGSALNTPRLMDIRVEPNDGQTEFMAVKDWVVHGEEFCAVARLKPGQTAESVTVSGSVGGKAFRREIPVENVAEKSDCLPRTWAKLAIDDMVARDAEKYKSQIVELSKLMYVMSPFTSLLVLENDEMYEQYNVDRGRKDHWALYPCPNKIEVVHEPLHGPQPATIAKPNATPVKPSVEEIWQTLLLRPRTFADRTSPPVNWTREFVTVPDGGTVLLGGIKRLGDINGNGVPMLSKLPYVNRLFRNGRDAEANSLMMIVTPRIIIQEEEEELLLTETLAFHDRRKVDIDNDGDGVSDAIWFGFDSVTDFVSSTIVPDAWDEVGGPGTIEAFPANLSLAISQSQEVHDQPDWMLRRLRLDIVGEPPTLEEARMWFDAQSPGGDFGNTAFSVDQLIAQRWSELLMSRRKWASVDLAKELGTAEQRILAKLRDKADFDYREQSLVEVIEDLTQQHDLPIVISTKALHDYGIDTEDPVTLQVENISLQSALNLILSDFGLSYFIIDDVLQITMPEEVERQLTAGSFGFEELLLLVRRSGSRVPKHPASLITANPRQVDQWARTITNRLEQGTTHASLLYPDRPNVAHRRTRRRLIEFAPAISTTRADVLAVVEGEANLEDKPQPGKVDARARELIEAARTTLGWQLITLRDQKDRVVLKLTIDGQGRFRFERKTEHGLRETVVCDGETLRHLYPELGLGTTRRVSRFHRADLTRLVPWFLPPVEDLAVGADLRMIGARTIAIAPHKFDEVKDDEGQPRRYSRLHLVFAEDGRLAERRIVEMPSGKTIRRVAYSDDGMVEWFDDDEQQGELQISVEKTVAPDLTPDVDELVVLPMPIRERGHIYEVAKTTASSSALSEKTDALRAIANDDQTADDPVNWDEADVLRLITSDHWQNPAELRKLIGCRFFARGDRRLGFYTLLFSSGKRWSVERPTQLDDGTTTQMDPLADHPKSVLARYIDNRLRGERFDVGDESQDDFISQLAKYQRLAARWSIPFGPPTDAETRRRELDELFGFISRCDSLRSAFTLLRRLQRRYGDSQPHGRIAEALIELEKHGTISYAIKYELARSLAASGEKDQAQALFVQLYKEVLDEGVLPPIDHAFRAALQESQDPFGSDSDGEKGFHAMMRGACAQLIERKQRPMAIALAWQCRQLDEAALGDILVDQVLTGVPDDEQLRITLAGLEYLVQAGKHDRAEALLQALLSSEPYSESPTLWRLAARVASDGGRLARSVTHLERAMDLEYASLPKSYNVEQVREQYSELFASYHELATIVAAPDADPPLDLVARAIEAADRWRSLDTDVTDACNNAARFLSELGREDLAWDYLTTPLALKPNEATAWLNLAQTLRNDGNFDLSARAYTSAFEAEPTNAQILWDHAQLLEQAGHGKEARTLYSQIADGDWQPRFNRIKHQAEQIDARGDQN